LRRFFQLGLELCWILLRFVAFLNARVLDQSLLQLFQALLEIRPERQRFCDFHRALSLSIANSLAEESSNDRQPQTEKANLISQPGLYFMPAMTYSPTPVWSGRPARLLTAAEYQSRTVLDLQLSQFRCVRVTD
jgi:hypothetical protein